MNNTFTSETVEKVTIDALNLRAAAGSDESKENGPNAVMYVWFQLFKTAQIHAIDNQALLRPIQAMVNLSVVHVAREGRLSLQAKDGELFVNGLKLRLTPDERDIAADAIDFFKARGMGGFVLHGSLSADDVRALLKIMVYASGNERTFDAIDAAIEQARLPLRINKPLDPSKKAAAEVILERRGHAFLTYAKLLVLCRSLIAEEHLTSSRRAFLSRKIARLVQTLVDLCLEDRQTFLGAIVAKTDDYAARHAANTAILAIAVGERIGLSKADLADLGLAAVFHDIGLRQCGRFILEKPAPLDGLEHMAVEAHPFRGAEFLLQESAFTRSVLSWIVVAFEHHRHFDGSGYPRSSRPADLYSRIITIADVYDALTIERPWRRALTPDEALSMMAAKSGSQFDPALLKIFVTALGLYPIGTLVRLERGELGLVVSGGGEAARVCRPVVLLLDAAGEAAGVVDLAQCDAAGQFLHSVVRAEDPVQYGINPTGLLACNAGVEG